jgi:radical SAM protein with 4Fe4S-binding SPASM domain
MIPVLNRNNHARMDKSLYRNIATLANTNLAIRKEKLLRLSFTGGEPLTLNSQFLTDAYETIRENLADDIQIEHRLNTSLIPYRSDHATYIHKYVDLIKTSLDFSTRKINGSTDKYHQLWLDKYHEVKTLGIPVIVNSTLTKNEIGKEKSLIKTLMSYGVEQIQISQFFKTGVPEDKRAQIPTNLEQSIMYCHIFDTVMDEFTQGRYVDVDICKSYPRIALKLPMRQEEGCQKGFFVIEPDGKISTCTMQSSIDQGIGGVKDSRANEILFSPKRLKHISYQQKTFQANCLTCTFFKNCNRRVCLHMPSDQQECMGYKVFLEHIVKRCQNALFKQRLMQYLEYPQKNYQKLAS